MESSNHLLECNEAHQLYRNGGPGGVPRGPAEPVGPWFPLSPLGHASPFIPGVPGNPGKPGIPWILLRSSWQFMVFFSEISVEPFSAS